MSMLIRRYAPRAIFHADGVQAYLKVDTDNLGVDLYSISAHKFHAPKGVGALYKRTGVRFAGGQMGGGQENNLRSGTLNVPGILGMEKAVALYEQNLGAWRQNMRACKRRLYDDLMTIPDVILNGPSLDEAALHILNLSFMGIRGEVLLHALEQFDVCVSTGSACAARKAGKNRILTAAGIIGPRQGAYGPVLFLLRLPVQRQRPLFPRLVQAFRIQQDAAAAGSYTQCFHRFPQIFFFSKPK